jgi:hypothetical protein
MVFHSKAVWGKKCTIECIFTFNVITFLMSWITYNPCLTLAIILLCEWRHIHTQLSKFCYIVQILNLCITTHNLVGFQQWYRICHHNGFLVTKFNPLLRKADWCGYSIQLRDLNFRHFKIVEAVGLTFMELMSPAAAWLNFMRICQLVQELLGETHRHRQTGYLINILPLWRKVG